VSTSDSSTFPSVMSLEPSLGSLMISNGPQQQEKAKPTRTLNDVTVLGPESLMGSRPASMARGAGMEAPGSSRKRSGPKDETHPSTLAQEEEGEHGLNQHVWDRMMTDSLSLACILCLTLNTLYNSLA
jgi:hypothetical protein